jgi:hypothetical protein
LIERAEPADHARLSAHFRALAERYAGEAQQHVAMAQAYGAGTGRRLSRNPGAHCDRLAELAKRSAETVRELAAHHERLSAGLASKAPRNSAPFHAGEGALAPTEGQLTRLAAQASTASDHRALAEYFLAMANRYSTEATEHVAMARAYRASANRRTGSGDPAAHCDRLVADLREAAKEANGAAAEHKERAGIAR